MRVFSSAYAYRPSSAGVAAGAAVASSHHRHSPLQAKASPGQKPVAGCASMNANANANEKAKAKARAKAEQPMPKGQGQAKATKGIYNLPIWRAEVQFAYWIARARVRVRAVFGSSDSNSKVRRVSARSYRSVSDGSSAKQRRER